MYGSLPEKKFTITVKLLDKLQIQKSLQLKLFT